MYKTIRRNDDGFQMYWVHLDFVQFGKIIIEVPADSAEEAVTEAMITMSSLKANDCSVEGVGLIIDVK